MASASSRAIVIQAIHDRFTRSLKSRSLLWPRCPDETTLPAFPARVESGDGPCNDRRASGPSCRGSGLRRRCSLSRL